MGKIINIIFVLLFTIIVLVAVNQKINFNKNPQEHIFIDIAGTLYSIDLNNSYDKSFYSSSQCEIDGETIDLQLICNKYSKGKIINFKIFNLIELDQETAIEKRAKILYWDKLNTNITIICLVILLFVIIFNIYRAKYKPEQWNKTPLSKIIKWINKYSK